jgi:putative copper export protein
VRVDLPSVVLRALALIGLFQAAGAALFLVLFDRGLSQVASCVRRLGRITAAAAIVLIAAHRALEAARMGDGFASLPDPALQRLAWSGGAGLAASLQILGLALIIGALRMPASRATAVGRSLSLIGAAVAATAAMTTGHTSVHPLRLELAPLLAVHLLVVAFWFGSLLPLVLCCRREPLPTAVAVLRAFSGVAGWLVPALGVAGLLMALILLPGWAAWHSTYAALVLTKLALFAVLLLFACWNRWRGVPSLTRPPLPAASAVLQRSIEIEYVLMLAVLAVTATLTTFYSP